MLKRLLLLALSLALSFSVIACSQSQTYSHCEMVLPLADDFYEVENADFDKSYSNGIAAVAILRLSFEAAFSSGIPETFNTEEFGRFWLRECGRSAEIVRYEGIAHCTYTESVGETDYFCLAAFYRTYYAYFVVLFTVEDAVRTEWEGEFLRYISNVYFTDYNA